MRLNGNHVLATVDTIGREMGGNLQDLPLMTQAGGAIRLGTHFSRVWVKVGNDEHTLFVRADEGDEGAFAVLLARNEPEAE